MVTFESESVTRSIVSNSLQPHGLQPARLLCAWDSTGRNAGVGCRSLLQGNLPDPGIKSRLTALQADSLPSEPPGKPWSYLRSILISASHDSSLFSIFIYLVVPGLSLGMQDL